MEMKLILLVVVLGLVSSLVITTIDHQQIGIAKECKILGGPGGVIACGGSSKHSSSNNKDKVKIPGTIPSAETPRYIAGTPIDCNLVFSYSAWYSQLAINACNQQYKK
jgi:hypothetical protein